MQRVGYIGLPALLVWTSFMVFNFQYCGHFYYRTLSVFVSIFVFVVAAIVSVILLCLFALCGA